LHFERFGYVLGVEPSPAARPAKLEYDEEAARLFGEQLYWEDYWERTGDDDAPKRKPGKQPGSAVALPVAPEEYREMEGVTDDDVPF
jgi:hypothetical protein